MRFLYRILCVLIVLQLFALPAFALDTEEQLMTGIEPEEGLSESEIKQIGGFDDRQSFPFWERVKALIRSSLDFSDTGSIRSGLKTVAVLLSAAMMGSMISSESSLHRGVTMACDFVVVTACASDLHNMIGLGVDLINRIRSYALALVPGLCSLAAAAGCGGTAAALRIGIAAALNLLPSMCTDLIVPFIYVFIGLSAAELALGLGGLKKLRELSSWVCISLLKWTSGTLTALLALSGCFSGAADAGKVKAARMVISGMIPMVGGAVSNASESLMNAAGILKTSVGSYAALAVMVMFLSPFLRIGAQYLLLRFSASLCGLFGVPSVTGIVERMTQALGMVLAMTGVVCLMTLFSFVICIQVTAI